MLLQAYFLDDESMIDLEELERRSGLTQSDIVTLVELGVVAPLSEGEEPWRFGGRAVALAQRAARLRHDFELDSAALALALTYLERIETLETRIRELECQLLR